MHSQTHRMLDSIRKITNDISDMAADEDDDYLLYEDFKDQTSVYLGDNHQLELMKNKKYPDTVVKYIFKLV